MHNQKINYDKLLKELVQKERGKSVMLHCCCAPCASHCITALTDKNAKTDNGCGLIVTAFYYNPCIFPKDEYQKRGENLKKLCDILSVKYLEGEYKNKEYLQMVKGLEDLSEGGERCRLCFYDRLFATATTAKEQGFDYFCTTLTVSPYKNSDLINQIGLDISKKTGIGYLPSDFKKGNGYLNSIKLSNEYKLYRQAYCGCVFSNNEIRK